MNNIERKLNDTFGCGNETLGIGGMDGESARRLYKAIEDAQGEILLDYIEGTGKFKLTEEEHDRMVKERWEE